MAKLTLNDLTQLSSNEASAVAQINANNTATETAMENTLSRDGTSPNTMAANIDMDGQYTLLNLPDAVNDSQPVTLRQLNASADGIVNIKDEGNLVLASASDLNFVGAGVTATDGGSGTATITIPYQTFLNLTDTPSSFTAGQLYRVNAGATALEAIGIGTEGQVLTVSSGVPVWAGAVGGPFGEFAYAPPISSSFTTAVVGTGASASLTDYAGKGMGFSITTASAVAIGGAAVVSPPTAPLTITAKLLAFSDSGIQINAGLVLRNSSNGRCLVVYGRNGDPSDNQVFSQTWSTLAAFNSSIVSGTTRTFYHLGNAYYAIHVDGSGNVKFYFSITGAQWFEMGSTTLGAYLTAAGGSLDQIGLFLFRGNVAGTAHMLCPYFRLDSTDPPALALA